MGKKAKESPAIERARAKLKKRFSDQKQLLKKSSINQMKKIMLNWLERHQEDRIYIESTKEEIFDTNQHPAKTLPSPCGNHSILPYRYRRGR